MTHQNRLRINMSRFFFNQTDISQALLEPSINSG